MSDPRTGGSTMTRLSVPALALAAATLIAAGCGDEDANGDGGAYGSAAATVEGGAESRKADASAAGKGRRIKVVDSDYGRVIADAKGEAFYLFDKETSKKPRCYGHCAEVWPPVLTKGRPVAGGGVKQGLLGTTRRVDGRLQATYAGHPLYYYVDDTPGTILCHDVAEFGGLWLVVEPGGKAAA
jgi:predicted lipoprotein with Yx(FWY)xxD motif